MTGWNATSAEINALPEAVRRWVHDLQTRCDPAGDLQARRISEDAVAGLRAERDSLAVALRLERERCDKIETALSVAMAREAELACGLNGLLAEEEE